MSSRGARRARQSLQDQTQTMFFFRKMKAFTETITDIFVVTNQVLLFVLLVLLCYYPKHIFGFQKSVQILF